MDRFGRRLKHDLAAGVASGDLNKAECHRHLFRVEERGPRSECKIGIVRRRLFGELTIQDPGCNDCYMTTRDRLLQSCLTYFLRHGVANLSLRPLAAAVGTSARMLLHYFGSKEALVAEVMEQVQRRLQESFKELLPGSGGLKSNPLPKFWKILSRKENLPSLRLLFEVQMLALQNPRRYRRYLTRSSASWRGLIHRALPPNQQNGISATLHNAVIDGLLLELLSTGELRRTSRALTLFSNRCSLDRRGKGNPR